MFNKHQKTPRKCRKCKKTFEMTAKEIKSHYNKCIKSEMRKVIA